VVGCCEYFFRDSYYVLPGHYFITICTKNRECLFGNVVNGKIVEMPNIHGIIPIVETPNLGVSTRVQNTANIDFHDHVIRDENELNRIRQ